MIEFILLIAAIFLLSPKKTKSAPKKCSPIVVKGCRAPEYYDIMEEHYAPLKAKLEEDAKNGVIYKKSKPLSLNDLMNGVKPEYYDQPASEALAKFNNYERNGYI